MTKLAKQLGAARRRAGLSMRELSRRLECSPAYVHRVETGAFRPSEERIRAICAEVGEDADRLMQRAGIVPDDVIRFIARTPGMVEKIRLEMAEG